jgi:hypothetical protein
MLSVSTTSGITQNAAGEYANGTRANVNTGEHAAVCEGYVNSMGRNRAPDIIDPYLAIRQARLRNQARWRMSTSDLDGEA